MDDVNWDDPALQRWLGGIARASTKAVYKTAFRAYAAFTGLTPSQLVNEALEDARRDPRERTDIVKQRLIGFYHWLTREAPRRGPGGADKDERGLSPKLGHTYIGAIRSFYDTFGIVVKLKGRSSLPKPRIQNKRKRLTNLEVKRLLDNCRSPRDRAIILVMFQSGMDVSTLCSLKYGNVAEGLEKGERPLRVDLYRPKTGVEYYTFLGKDACEALRAYLNDLKARGITLSYNDPLFLKEGAKALTKEPMAPNLVQKLMRELAVKAGFVDEKMNGMTINPLSPHALRESFGSILTGKGVPKTVVDFLLGHEVGEMARAYQEAGFEDIKKMYLECEPFLSIAVGGDEKLKELEEKSQQTQRLINNLAAENLELRKKVSAIEEKLAELEGIVKRVIS